MPEGFSFKVEATADGTAARAATLTTPHGDCLLPMFMPVGTQATVKALDPRDLRELGAMCVLSNTYHLYLRPGADKVAAFGGLHKFMGWNGPMLTDSGGFQVFSLSNTRKIDEDGVTFRSHIDGSKHRFTPEMVMETEEKIGADIAMALDECTPYPSDERYNLGALKRTHSWAERCLAAHKKPDQALFAIVQGGTFPELRRQSAEFLTSLDFPGYAIGGLSVGEPKQLMHDILDVTTPILPADKPRYLMGVGSPEDLWEIVDRGIDMFDCVLPTRIARNGALLTRRGRIAVKSAKYSLVDGPIEAGCDCYTCQNFSLGYLNHLFRAGELLVHRLNSIHNVRFLVRLAAEIRQSIFDNNFVEKKREFLENYRIVDHEVANTQRQKWLVAHNRVPVTS